jgi:hypothetical protein
MEAPVAPADSPAPWPQWALSACVQRCSDAFRDTERRVRNWNEGLVGPPTPELNALVDAIRKHAGHATQVEQFVDAGAADAVLQRCALFALKRLLRGARVEPDFHTG